MDLCRELSISTATGKNWIKAGKLIPDSYEKNQPLFTKEHMLLIKEKIKTGESNILKSRRNKKYISGNEFYKNYLPEGSKNIEIVRHIISYGIEKNILWDEKNIRLLLAEYAISLLFSKTGYERKPKALLSYKKEDFLYSFLIEDLLSEALEEDGKEFIQKNSFLFEQPLFDEPLEDFLGLLYLSLKNKGERKSAGAYFTPASVVASLCHNLFSKNNFAGKTILDPCCGCGNFILHLPPEIEAENIYGFDIDLISVQIARINYALKYNIEDPQKIYDHIKQVDYLSLSQEESYDIILGNPPWGMDFESEEKEMLREKFQAASKNSIESYDLFLEQSVSMLTKEGVLSFVLPEAFLSARNHHLIREILLQKMNIQYVEFLGEIFHAVHCPSLIFQLKKEAFSEKGWTVKERNKKYSIQQSRLSSNFLDLLMPDEDYIILQKIEKLENKTTLFEKAEFAMGIVTGDNKRYLSKEKTEENEPIIKGSDLSRYHISSPKQYISFNPASFQQVAAEEYYRAKEKILYRFIGENLMFAYDNKQRLSLNSANFLIPKIPNLDIKYILAILNSSVIQFYFRKKYRSAKVLKSHIERFPIPDIPAEKQQDIISYVENILSSEDPIQISKMDERLDQKISLLYSLSDSEYKIIKNKKR